MDSRPARLSPPPRGGRCRGFTLIEIIAVLAVLAIVFAVSLPAVTSLSKSSSRRAAATLVLSTLDQARAMALSRNGTYYLALADGNKDWPENYRCRAFAIYEEVFNPANTAKPYQQLPVTGWTQLPAGVAFQPAADTVFQSAMDANVTFYCQSAGKEMNTPYFKFNSLGAVEVPTDATKARLRIFEGFFDAAGQPVATNRATAAEEVLLVSLVTGRARRVEQ
jgi:prepilin-type N-terminal cleavage/methylation domain-containing protein